MLRLPKDIYLDILSRIPAKSLLTCKCVCKGWYAEICSSDFVKLHLNVTLQKNKPNLLLRQSINPDNDLSRRDENLIFSVANGSLASASWVTDFWIHAVQMDFPFKFLGSSVELIGSCNGLVCIRDGKLGFFCFWNPTTKEYALIPKFPDPVSFHDEDNFHYAFGYDYKNEDYKLISLVSLDENNYGSSSVEAYSLRSNSWKSNQTIRYRFPYYFQNGLFVDEAFHWLVKARDSAELLIVSLDITNERFEEIQLPEECLDILSLAVLEGRFCVLSLGILEGCLCVLVDYPNVRVEVWVLQNYGVRRSWTKRFIIKNQGMLSHIECLRLMWSFESGEILFEILGFPILYDSRCDSITYLDINTEDSDNREAEYFETLVSLNSGSYVGREKLEDIKEYEDSKND